jgi:hypothetical protein
MKALSSVLAVAVLLPTLVSPSIGQQATIYGAYQDCPFHCRTIRINPDHTFDYRLNGDLYNDQRYRGTWKFIGQNKIKANSPVDHSPLQVSERRGAESHNYSLFVLDPNGAVVPGVVVSGVANNKPFTVTTNSDGTAQIPICRRFRVSYKDYWGVHEIRSAAARRFVIGLTPEQMFNDAINEAWLVENNRLYVAAEDGSFYKDHWLDKLSVNEARKIFH